MFDLVGEPGWIGNRKLGVHSEILGDTDDTDINPDAALEGYRKNLVTYFGEQKGNEIYDGAIRERTKREAVLGGVQGRVPENAKETGGSGVQGEHTATGNSHSVVPQPRTPGEGWKGVRFSKAARHIGLREKPNTVEHIKSWFTGTKDWFKVDLASILADDLHPVAELEGGQNLAPGMSGYKSLRLMRSLGSIMGTLMTTGKLKYDDARHFITLAENDSGGLLEVFKGLDAKSLEMVKLRLVADRVRALLKAGKHGPEVLDRIYGDDENGKPIDPVAYTKELLNETDLLLPSALIRRKIPD